MRHSALDYARAYLAAAGTARADDVSAVAGRLVGLVRRRRQPRLLKQILAHVERLSDEQQGIVAYRLITAAPIDQELLRQMLGPAVKYTLLLDNRIIGGAIIEHDDERIDASIRLHLERLRTELHHSAP
ncbi:MAG: F0F1 ATP synthase subunit delta [Candidatus Kerfeldbacteria bacterium]|nr:F0F1 ATP synthase subunit delta [Candidatus Kerfeldbacteria bacterium]